MLFKLTGKMTFYSLKKNAASNKAVERTARMDMSVNACPFLPWWRII